MGGRGMSAAGWQTRRARYGPNGGNVGGNVGGSKPWPMERRKHGAVATYYDGCRCIVCVSAELVRAHRRNLVAEWVCTSGTLLPLDFDDDTRITSAQFQHHPPQAWVET